MDKLKHANEPCLYMCGQSLGLKPKSADYYAHEVLSSWAKYGVHSHFNGFLAAASADTPPKEPMAKVVGAKESEVAIMGSLTANLHTLFSSFYRPTEQRYKIIIEQHAFSSDMVRTFFLLFFHFRIFHFFVQLYPSIIASKGCNQGRCMLWENIFWKGN